MFKLFQLTGVASHCSNKRFWSHIISSKFGSICQGGRLQFVLALWHSSNIYWFIWLWTTLDVLVYFVMQTASLVPFSFVCKISSPDMQKLLRLDTLPCFLVWIIFVNLTLSFSSACIFNITNNLFPSLCLFLLLQLIVQWILKGHLKAWCNI